MGDGAQLAPPPAGEAAGGSLKFGLRMSVAVRSLADLGRGERENQDNYLLIDTEGRLAYLSDQQEVRAGPLADWPAGHARIAILDGMGGHDHGREVAERVVQRLAAVPACCDLDSLSTRLDALHGELHQQFSSPAGEDKANPGTTLTLLELPPDGPALLYHVGDSRLFEVTADRSIPLTIDHVPATGHLLRGLIDEEDWHQHVYERDGSEVSQAFVLGSTLLDPGELRSELTPLRREELPVGLAGLEDRRAIELCSGMLLVLATDGMWSTPSAGAWLNRWGSILGVQGRPLQSLVDDLFTEFILNPPEGLRVDNCTVLALRVA